MINPKELTIDFSSYEGYRVEEDFAIYLGDIVPIYSIYNSVMAGYVITGLTYEELIKYAINNNYPVKRKHCFICRQK